MDIRIRLKAKNLLPSCESRQVVKKEEGEERKSKDKVKTAVCLLNPKILFSSHAPTSEVDIFHLDQKATKMDLW